MWLARALWLKINIFRIMFRSMLISCDKLRAKSQSLVTVHSLRDPISSILLKLGMLMFGVI